MKTLDKKKIDKVLELISKEIKASEKTCTEYTVVLTFNSFDNTIRFDKDHLESTSLNGIEQEVIKYKLISMLSTTEDKIISFNKFGANYNTK